MGHDLSRALRALWWRTATDGYQTAANQPSATIWLARVAEIGLPAIVDSRWSITPNDKARASERLGDGFRVLFESIGDYQKDCVASIDDVLVHLNISRDGSVAVQAAAKSLDDATKAVERIKERLPKITTTPEGSNVPVAFWSRGAHGPAFRVRKIECVKWDEIRANYTARTRATLERCLTPEEGFGDAGKLMLWLGPPGTGKTFALRALAWEQRVNTRIHYILDPEEFLGSADYLAAVFRDEDEEADTGLANADGDIANDNQKNTPTTRLIILEDSGELLGADAASRVGKGLSRLLNMTDGLPGQGLRAQILITTNEDVGRLHPAVTRPGRCAALVRFTPFDIPEAREWLRARDREASLRGPTSLAELYAIARGVEDRPTPKAVGFDEPRLA